jgi:hypothetical protein
LQTLDDHDVVGAGCRRAEADDQEYEEEDFSQRYNLVVMIQAVRPACSGVPVRHYAGCCPSIRANVMR